MSKGLTIFGVACALLISGCSVDSKGKANELYVKASEYSRSMNAESKSHAKKFDLYKSAKNKLEFIVTNYSSTNLAAELSSGKTKISGYTLDEFSNLEEPLSQLTKIEQAPMSLWLEFLSEKAPGFEPKINTLHDLASAYSEGGNNQKALMFFDQLLEGVNTLKDGEKKNHFIVMLFIEYAKFFKNEKALRLLSQAEINAKTVKGYPIIKYKNLLEQIADGYAHNGKYKKSSQLLSQAYEITIQQKSPDASILTSIAKVYAKIGDEKKATQLLEEAVKTLITLKTGNSIDYDVENIIFIYAEIGRKDRAIQVISEALKKDKERGYILVDNLVSYAKMYDYIGAKKKSVQLLKQAEKKIKNEKRRDRQVLNTLNIAKGYAEIGEKYNATRLHNEALADGTVFNDGTLSSISVSQSKLGKFIQASETANKIGNKREKNVALHWVAREYAKKGRFLIALKTTMTMSGARGEGGAYKGTAFRRVIYEQIKTGKIPSYDFTSLVYDVYKNIFADVEAAG